MLLKRLLINIIKFYHNYLSGMTLCRCRFTPTCSEYTVEAIQDKGIFKGMFRGVRRILRCNPFHPGGYDPYTKE